MKIAQQTEENGFGDYLRAGRERCCLSLSEAAELVKCSKQHLWSLEQGASRNPSIVVLANIACAYDYDLGVLANMAAASAPGTAYRVAIGEFRDAKKRLALVRT